MEITTEAKRKKKLSEYEAHLRVSWQKRYRPPSWWSRTTQITFSLFLKSNLSDLSSPSSLSVWLLTDVANDVYSHFLESISHISYRPRLGSFSLEHKRLPVEDAGVLAFSLLNYLRRGKSFLLVNFCLTIWGEIFFSLSLSQLNGTRPYLGEKNASNLVLERLWAIHARFLLLSVCALDHDKNYSTQILVDSN